jgi:hypothetical protein
MTGNLIIGSGATTGNKSIHIEDHDDAYIFLEADEDDVGEDDNPFIYFSQDNTAVQGVIGFVGGDGLSPSADAYTGALNNSMFVGGIDAWPLQFGTNNNVRMTIESGGDIGIGITNPQSTLQIAGVLTLGVESTTDGQIIFEDSGGKTSDADIRTNSSGDLILRAHASSAEIIFETGNPESTRVVIQADGDLDIEGDFYGSGADIAELFYASEEITPGTVVEIDPENPMHVRISRTAYNTLVAGIYSTDPGAIFSSRNGDIPIAIAGRVPVKVNLENGPINPGDLLTTSSVPGEAMRCDDKIKCLGATLGKALEGINTDGIITVLVISG